MSCLTTGSSTITHWLGPVLVDRRRSVMSVERTPLGVGDVVVVKTDNLSGTQETVETEEGSDGVPEASAQGEA